MRFTVKAILLFFVSLSTLSHAEWGTGVEIGTLCPYPMAVAPAAVKGQKLNPRYRLNPYRAALPGYYNPGANYGTIAGAIGHGAFGCDPSVFSAALMNPWLSAGPDQENPVLNAGWAPIEPSESSEPQAVPLRGLASEVAPISVPSLEMPEFGRRSRSSRLLLLDNR